MLLAARSAVAAGAQREYAVHIFSPLPLPNAEKPVPPVVGAPPFLLLLRLSSFASFNS